MGKGRVGVQGTAGGVPPIHGPSCLHKKTQKAGSPSLHACANLPSADDNTSAIRQTVQACTPPPHGCQKGTAGIVGGQTLARYSILLTTVPLFFLTFLLVCTVSLHCLHLLHPL